MKKIQVGDIIRCYHAGYHRVDKIVPRDDPPTPNNFIVHYTKVVDTNGKKSRNLKNHCHIDYCCVLTPEYIERHYQDAINRAKLLRDKLMEVISE